MARISALKSSAGISGVVLVAIVLLLVSPVELPDFFYLGGPLSLAFLVVFGALVIWLANLNTITTSDRRLDWLLFGYLAIVALTAVTSVDRWQTLRAAAVLVAQVALFYATVIAAERAPWLRAAVPIAVIVGSALVELMAFAYHAEFGFQLRPAGYPIPPGWGGYPELSALLTVQLGCLMAAATTGRALARWFARALMLFAVAEMAFLYSRTAWVAFVVMTLATIVVAEAGRRKRALLRTAAVLLLIGGAAMTVPTVRALAISLAGVPSAVAYVPGTTTPMSRLLLWGKTLNMISDSPAYGVGLGNFRRVFETEYHVELASDQRRGVHAHNLWLQQAAEIGILGGLIVVALWIRVLVLAAQNARRLRTFPNVALFLALIGGVVSNLVDGVPYQALGIRVYLLYWIFFGLVAAGTSLQPIAPQFEPRKRPDLH